MSKIKIASVRKQQNPDSSQMMGSSLKLLGNSLSNILGKTSRGASQYIDWLQHGAGINTFRACAVKFSSSSALNSVRSIKVDEELMPAANLLAWFHSELGYIARLSPDSACLSEYVFCPFKVNYLAVREDSVRHRASLVLCPNPVLASSMLKLQNIHLSVLGICIIMKDELRQFLQQTIRENDCSRNVLRSSFAAFEYRDLVLQGLGTAPPP